MASHASALGIIPARVHSSRLPKKVLAPILGKPMIQHVWEAAKRCQRLSKIVVATDCLEIVEAVQKFGGEAVLTQGEFASGTDRVAAVAKNCAESVVVNLQGDEPLLDSQAVDEMVEVLQNTPSVDMATLAVQKVTKEDLEDPHVVKVLVSQRGEALYFSRQPLRMNSSGEYLKHIGIYGFQKAALERFVSFSPSPLEQAERLEQLRALDNGMVIKVVLQERDSIAVDVARDIERVERYLIENQRNPDQGASL